MTDVPVAVRERRRATGYEYLTPLFVERAALPVGHPCRERLRAELIVGFMPVARHIAWKYAHHGDSREDLEQVAPWTGSTRPAASTSWPSPSPRSAERS
jgi:hypothetical protein